MNKEKYFIDLSKLSEEQIKEIEILTDRKIDECYLSDKLFFYDGKWEASGGYAILKLNLTEITYPEFIKLFEGGENYPGKRYQPLFDHLNREHGLILHENEMDEIIRIVYSLNSNR